MTLLQNFNAIFNLLLLAFILFYFYKPLKKRIKKEKELINNDYEIYRINKSDFVIRRKKDGCYLHKNGLEITFKNFVSNHSIFCTYLQSEQILNNYLNFQKW